ncbi:hypothetical protein [uncultured Megasphaera sp.]|uniref:hypothetical protein n=1 Tax=uncultured Megasphaera sp. TaxID=165188 RepID=UPI0025945727|nr:hypothetical protein [uncultured Megasphaera sp.]
MTYGAAREVLARYYAARIIEGRHLVLDGEFEVRESDGAYTYIHCTTLDDKLTFRVTDFSLLDAIEERDVSPIFGIPLPPYRLLLADTPCREYYEGIEAAAASAYYPLFQQLQRGLEDNLRADTEIDDEETPDTWDRPDMIWEKPDED